MLCLLLVERKKREGKKKKEKWLGGFFSQPFWLCYVRFLWLLCAIKG
jgi:hypothetical protein